MGLFKKIAKTAAKVVRRPARGAAKLVRGGERGAGKLNRVAMRAFETSVRGHRFSVVPKALRGAARAGYSVPPGMTHALPKLKRLGNVPAKAFRAVPSPKTTIGDVQKALGNLGTARRGIARQAARGVRNVDVSKAPMRVKQLKSLLGGAKMPDGGISKLKLDEIRRTLGKAPRGRVGRALGKAGRLGTRLGARFGSRANIALLVADLATAKGPGGEGVYGNPKRYPGGSPEAARRIIKGKAKMAAARRGPRRRPAPKTKIGTARSPRRRSN